MTRISYAQEAMVTFHLIIMDDSYNYGTDYRAGIRMRYVSTNNVVNFEQLGPGCLWLLNWCDVYLFSRNGLPREVPTLWVSS